MASRVQQLQLAPEQVVALVRVLKLVMRYSEERKRQRIYEDEKWRELESLVEIVLDWLLNWLSPTGSPLGSGAQPSGGRIVGSKYGEVELTKKAYRLWQLLHASPGDWWDGEKLSEKLGSKRHAVTQLISRLKQQLQPIHLDKRIETQRGSGWRWAA